MAFHDVQLPTAVQYGSQFGAGFATFAQQTASGHEYRIARQAQPRHKFRLRETLKSVAEASALKEFALGRRGMLHSFRLKDWTDYNTSSTGAGTVTRTDQILGSYTGSSATFQLVKVYDASGDAPLTRTITLPISGTVLVAIAGTLKTEGVDYTVNYSSGVVTVNGGLSTGTLTAGCEFDVPARFERSTDMWTALQPDAFGVWNLGDLECIEVLDETEYPERWYPGGVTDWGSTAADIAVSLAGGSLQRVTPTANINAYLPAVPLLFPGGDRVFTVKNDAPATYTVQMRDDAGNAVGTAIAAATAKQLACSVFGGSFSWVIL